MKTVEEIAAAIVAREGGYVDDPDDPGGATNHGVTIGTMRRLGIDLDRDGDFDEGDVKALNERQAAEIFIRHYFQGPGLARLPQALQPNAFDFYVNAGANAVRVLQRLLCQMGFAVTADGQIGPQTAAAAARAMAAAPGHLADAYAIARRNYYYDLADRRPGSRKYARARDGGKGGWITRAEEFVSPKYRLTLAQHRERTSAWA